MKILVVGGGGREHALCWKIAQSPLLDTLYCAPGNPGIAELAECVHINADEIDALREFAQAGVPRVPARARVGRTTGHGSGGGFPSGLAEYLRTSP